MAQADNTPAGSEGAGSGSGAQAASTGSNNPAGRRYKKRKEQKQDRDSGLAYLPADLPNANAEDDEESQTDDSTQPANVQEVTLVPLDVYKADEAKMANVFGSHPQATGSVSSSLRLNPLVYDKSGTVVVPSDQAQMALGRPEDSADHAEEPVSRGKKGTYKRPKKAFGAGDDAPSEGGLDGPKINYSKNFRFKSRSEENGDAGGKNGVKKLTSFGVVMPSRVKGNTIPKNQLVAAGGTSQYALSPNGQPERNKADIEAANRRREMRRRWRYVIILILIILFFGLILTVVLYFATQAP